MCSSAIKILKEQLNGLATKKGGNIRRTLKEYAKFARQSANSEQTRNLALKNGEVFVKTLNGIDDMFTKIDESSRNKNWTNMIGSGLTSTPKKTLKTLLKLYLEHGSTIPPKQENEHIAQATGEEKVKIVA